MWKNVNNFGVSRVFFKWSYKTGVSTEEDQTVLQGVGMHPVGSVMENVQSQFSLNFDCEPEKKEPNT